MRQRERWLVFAYYLLLNFIKFKLGKNNLYVALHVHVCRSLNLSMYWFLIVNLKLSNKSLLLKKSLLVMVYASVGLLSKFYYLL